MELTPTDRKLLTVLQRPFPLVVRPFTVLGDAVGLSEEEAFLQTRSYQEEGLLRHIRGVFEARALGYRSVLVAARVERARLREAAAIISEHPGVSHNYGRTHELNLWFTLAIGPGKDLEATVARLASDARLEHYRILPMVRQYKIGVLFDLETASQGSSTTDDTAVGVMPPKPALLSNLDIALVRTLQAPLPLSVEPFAAPAASIGLSQEELLASITGLKERGILRRYAGMVAHRTAGFHANAMVCWRVPDDRAEEVGRKLASFSAVSHCYERPTYPDWPYNLFTMLHARKRAECEEMAEEMAKAVGEWDHTLLMSTREFKKAPVRYFPEEIPMPRRGGEEWATSRSI